MIAKSRAADTASALQAAAPLEQSGSPSSPANAPRIGTVPPPPDITASRRVATMRRLCEAYHCNVSAICLVLVHSIT